MELKDKDDEGDDPDLISSSIDRMIFLKSLSLRCDAYNILPTLIDAKESPPRSEKDIKSVT